MRTIGMILLATASACNWMEFDDQAKATWVDSTHKPDVKSSDWGVAIAASPGASASGGTLTVIGAGEGTYSQLNYSTEGSSSLSTNSFRLTMAGVQTLDAQPILIADPTSNKVAVISTSGGNQSAAIFADATAIQFFGPQTVAAATWFAGAEGEQILAGAAAIVYLGGSPGGVENICTLTGTAPVDIKAIATIANGAVDDFIVWNGDGKLLLFPNSIYKACTITASGTGMQAATLEGTSGFSPGRGSRILPIAGTRFYLLEGHQDGNDNSILELIDGSTLTVVGSPIAEPKQRTAVVLQTATKLFAVAGYPTASVDGVVAGQAIAYEIEQSSPTELTDIMPGGAMTLHDAQPDDNQTFGRALAVMPFNGKNVLVVSADNEMFAYFRTTQYDETRTGR